MLIYESSPFRRALENNYFGKASLINFINTLNKIPKHCIFAAIFLIEVQAQGPLRKELLVAPFVGRFERATLRKFYW